MRAKQAAAVVRGPRRHRPGTGEARRQQLRRAVSPTRPVLASDLEYSYAAGEKSASEMADPTLGMFRGPAASGETGTRSRRFPFERSVRPVFRRRLHKFLDTVTFFAKAGNGGDGIVLWTHLYCNEYAGPGGGCGGDGGDVNVQCTDRVSSLVDVVAEGYVVYDNTKPQDPHGVCHAGVGIIGDRAGMAGNKGLDVCIPVPPGTVLLDADTNRELCQFTRIGEMYTVAKGGRGGVGNKFLKTSTNRAPDYASLGQEGEGRMVTLELRSITDLAMIGRPNAGKSTLLGAMSRTAPQPSPWEFTTWRPHVGKVFPDESSCFTVADLPALEGGAHQGNTQQPPDFLRHCWRTHGLLYVIDCCNQYRKKNQPDDRSTPPELEHIPLWETIGELQRELDLYQEGLSHRAMAVVVTKCDVLVDPITGEPTWPRIEELQRRTNLPVFPVSAHSKKGVLDLALYLAKMTKKAQDDAARMETDRTRELRDARSMLDRIRLSEYKQVLLQRAQDYHLSRAVEEVLKERIRGRPNAYEEQQARMYAARARVAGEESCSVAADCRAAGPEAGIRLLECGDAEEAAFAPSVDFDAVEDAGDEVPEAVAEDWDVGGPEDLREERRVRRYSQRELWHPNAIAADAADEEKRCDTYALSEATREELRAQREWKREEYSQHHLASGPTLPESAVPLLAAKWQERRELREKEVESGVRTGSTIEPALLPSQDGSDAPPVSTARPTPSNDASPPRPTAPPRAPPLGPPRRRAPPALSDTAVGSPFADFDEPVAPEQQLARDALEKFRNDPAAQKLREERRKPNYMVGAGPGPPVLQGEDLARVQEAWEGGSLDRLSRSGPGLVEGPLPPCPGGPAVPPREAPPPDSPVPPGPEGPPDPPGGGDPPLP
eukprot:TRINITY_DN60052_c0_g1_i1.p1 TRINITY_DN60052_c0_g1~~TRINITY_DN60052_c0_g1_i1.p1  ORF type:complete len:888 (+),score=214.46 TRINITY_DN60052_c0_g1_i1:75-2738(+)